jgi:hypothetical protein
LVVSGVGEKNECIFPLIQGGISCLACSSLHTLARELTRNLDDFRGNSQLLAVASSDSSYFIGTILETMVNDAGSKGHVSQRPYSVIAGPGGRCGES